MVIAIGGCSRAGKSVLAQKLVKFYGPHRAVHISQDDYVLPASEIPTIQNHIDWETPDSMDWDRLFSTIAHFQKNWEIVIVEGIFAFSHINLLKHTDISIYIEISAVEFARRKKVDLRWGAEPDWYIQHIWNCHIHRLSELPKDVIIISPKTTSG